MNSEKQPDTILTLKKNSYNSYITMKYQKRDVKKKKKHKTPRNKPDQEGKDLHAENYKTLIKEMKEDSKK